MLRFKRAVILCLLAVTFIRITTDDRNVANAFFLSQDRAIYSLTRSLHNQYGNKQFARLKKESSSFVPYSLSSSSLQSSRRSSSSRDIPPFKKATDFRFYNNGHRSFHLTIKKATSKTKLRRLLSTSLLATNKNGDEQKKKSSKNLKSASNDSNNKIVVIDVPLKVFQDLTSQIKLKWNETAETVVSAIPDPIIKITTPVFQLLQLLWNGYAKIQWYLYTFTAGAVLSIAALIVPIQDSVGRLAQPVTLFETILNDLDQAYVEPVDTNKLFETGISAMLQSLDPYTEFEAASAATALSESIDGKYGGVGLVIAGIPDIKLNKQQSMTKSKTAEVTPPLMDISDSANSENEVKLINKNNDFTKNQGLSSGDVITSAADFDEQNAFDDVEDDDDDDTEIALSSRSNSKQERFKSVRVVSAFEGYAYDYGLRVGDTLVKVDDLPITPTTSLDQVRNKLRGQPGTVVEVAFQRDGVDGIQTVSLPRSVVRIRDVKLATLVGDPADGIGYIQLSGFASDAGLEVRNAVRYLQQAAEDASGGEQSLQGLVLDMRGNPGGLLTSAVDVASLFVPKGSDIVSAKGRGFPGVIYRSRVDPILDTSKTKLAVLVNGNTASAAEIVSGAIQDLDVGIIVGADRTFGKGLVQNVEELPFNTALKFTVAKYYTPSGRCIQGIKYTEGGGAITDDNDGRFIASKIREKDRSTYYTRLGRIVKDGGGIEADYKVISPKASVLEITLLRTGVINDFAAEWSKKHELTNNFHVDEDTYRQFQNFVAAKQKSGELKLEALYEKPLQELKRTLKKSGYVGSEKSVEQLQARIITDIKNDFEKYRSDIKEDISNGILARYLPESMLIERSIKTDFQVNEAVKLVKSRSKFDKLLAQGSVNERGSPSSSSAILGGMVATKTNKENTIDGFSSSNENNRFSSGPSTTINVRDIRNEGFRSSITW